MAIGAGTSSTATWAAAATSIAIGPAVEVAAGTAVRGTAATVGATTVTATSPSQKEFEDHTGAYLGLLSWASLPNKLDMAKNIENYLYNYRPTNNNQSVRLVSGSFMDTSSEREASPVQSTSFIEEDMPMDLLDVYYDASIPSSSSTPVTSSCLDQPIFSIPSAPATLSPTTPSTTTTTTTTTIATTPYHHLPNNKILLLWIQLFLCKTISTQST
ncbi:hypothetical protein BDA99DRAFT_565467 [Phascolomyces articulosus]|uniref:Uncharacterized protein n=1 Tax=Phascolomyces articulosus TaxID=60185 RepID=A0AAD5JY77_9FUNG|nr:hypothetical protein BDA99DRAFT_565467 [Phascolomyces articulosus]